MNWFGVLISALLFSATVVGYTNPLGVTVPDAVVAASVNPTVVPASITASYVASHPAAIYSICNSQNVCANVLAGLDGVRKICVFKVQTKLPNVF